MWTNSKRLLPPLILITVIIFTVFASGCTAPTARRISIVTITVTGTHTHTLTTPYYVTETITRRSTTITTFTFMNITTLTTSILKASTITKSTVISSGGTVITTKTFTVYVNVLGNGNPNTVSFFLYYPTQAVTYTISKTITLTYTPYYTPFPNVTVTKTSEPIIVAINNSTTTVYYPAISGTYKDVTEAIKNIFSWWDYLYVQPLQSFITTMPTDPLLFIVSMSSEYTYNTVRAVNYSRFYLPIQMLTTKNGNDGDFAEFYAACNFAEDSIGTVVIVSIGKMRHYVFIRNNQVTDANTRYFRNLQALVNYYVYFTNTSTQTATITLIVIGTYQPIRTMTTTVITPQPIWFLNTIPTSESITIAEKRIINSYTTWSIEYAGWIESYNGALNIIEMIKKPTTRYMVSYTGNNNEIVEWVGGMQTILTPREKTYVYAGGLTILPRNPISLVLPYVFDAQHVTYATITNHTTIVRGAFYILTNGIPISYVTFARTKILNTEKYTYIKINAYYSYTATLITGTIYYNP